MEKLLVKLMFIAAITQLGLSVHDFKDCHNRGCLIRIEKASRNILNVDWKPIVVFPKESNRFH